MAERKKLENENAPWAFKIANDVYNGRMSHTEGRNWLATHCGFNGSTAADLIADFRYMMNGESFERKLNRFYADYFLQQIYELYGAGGLDNALKALAQHVHYYEGQSKTTMHVMRQLMIRYRELLLTTREDLLEQQIIEREVGESPRTRLELMAKIRSLEISEQLMVEINGLALRRKNWIIALIKQLREHRCQVCGAQIRTKDGGYYIEAAHITAKAEEGNETLDNILILCPNHHKEFDWGERQIIERNSESITLVLNGRTYRIGL
jgi:5-methylcytosine-specific restriction protein A